MAQLGKIIPSWFAPKIHHDPQGYVRPQIEGEKLDAERAHITDQRAQRRDRERALATFAAKPVPNGAALVACLATAWYGYPLTVAGYRASVALIPKDAVSFAQRYADLREEKNTGFWTLTVGHEGLLEATAGTLVYNLTISTIQRFFPKWRIDPSTVVHSLDVEEGIVEPKPTHADPLDPVPSPWFRDGAQGFAAHTFAAIVRGIAIRPLTLARIRVNTQLPAGNEIGFSYNGQTHAIEKIFTNEGYTPFVRGLGLSVLISVLSCMIQDEMPARRNFLYKQATRVSAIRDNSKVLAATHALFTGVSSVIETTASLIILRPLEVVLRRIDMQGSNMEELLGMAKYTGIIDCIKSIFVNEGIFGFYKGLREEVVRDIPLAFVAAVGTDLLLSYKGVMRPKTYADW